MTVKCGDAVSISLNGTKYKVLKGTEPQVNKGGKVIEEDQEYGDGTSSPYLSNKVASISGLQIVVEEENSDAFEAAKSLGAMPVVLECVSKSYECTGYILGEVTISAPKRTTSEFTIKVPDGAGIRES